MKHREKQRLARKLQSKEELLTWGKGIFESKKWEDRKEAIANKINKLKKKVIQS